MGGSMNRSEDHKEQLGRMVSLLIDYSAPIESNFLTHPERILIHQRHQAQHLTKTLANNYPKTSDHLSQDKFRTLSAQYHLAYPCCDPVLDRHGKTLPEFLNTSTWRVSYPYLSQLALLERTLSEFSSASYPESPLKLNELRRYSQAGTLTNLTVYLNPSLQIITSDGDLWQLWHYPKSHWQSSQQAQWIGVWQTDEIQMTKFPTALAPMIIQVLNDGRDIDDVWTQLASEQGILKLQECLGFGLQAGWLHAAPS